MLLGTLTSHPTRDRGHPRAARPGVPGSRPALSPRGAGRLVFSFPFPSFNLPLL